MNMEKNCGKFVWSTSAALCGCRKQLLEGERRVTKYGHIMTPMKQWRFTTKEAHKLAYIIRIQQWNLCSEKKKQIPCATTPVSSTWSWNCGDCRLYFLGTEGTCQTACSQKDPNFTAKSRDSSAIQYPVWIQSIIIFLFIKLAHLHLFLLTIQT